MTPGLHRNKKTPYPAVLVSALLAAFTSSASAEEDGHRHHGAHVHGHGELSIASDESQLLIVLNAAAGNFLSFEHSPQTPEEVAAVEALKAQLTDMETVLRLPSKAKCNLQQVSFDYADADTDHHEDRVASGDEDAHADHENEHHEHSPEHSHEHPAVNETDHEEAETQKHLNVEVTYHLSCQSISSLKSVTVSVFDHFSGFEEIEAVYLLEDKQSAQVLTPGETTLKIR